MSEEQLKAFLKKVKSDTELQEEQSSKRRSRMFSGGTLNPTEAAQLEQIAKDAGFAITAEDIQSMQWQEVSLIDEELEKKRVPEQMGLTIQLTKAWRNF